LPVAELGLKKPLPALTVTVNRTSMVAVSLENTRPDQATGTASTTGDDRVAAGCAAISVAAIDAASRGRLR
jgi:hypothetical protein